VYLCYDHHEDRPVALKTFKPEYLPDREARDRFLREGTAWVNLGKHPHIVRAYGVEYIGEGREVFLVLEQIAKEQGCHDASLRSWLTPGQPLPADQALLIALQIARGLRHASNHIPGFVHRDLKPENVLVGADRLQGWPINRVRVTDFGLAAVMESVTLPDRGDDAQSADVRHTQLTHGIVGTPLYMAPEQWRGEAVSAQTDIYALGCILFEMLAGEHAVDGRTMHDLEQAHRAGKRRPWPKAAPAAARGVAERCLALAPASAGRVGRR
jgi:serine/threonine protein kinase